MRSSRSEATSKLGALASSGDLGGEARPGAHATATHPGRSTGQPIEWCKGEVITRPQAPLRTRALSRHGQGHPV
eukprot:5326388-Alexandrium_andersonii.AAC.1